MLHLLMDLFPLVIGITAVMAQRGLPVPLFPGGVIGANVANTPAGISNVVAIPQYATRGVEQVRASIIYGVANPTAVQIDIEGNDVDPTDNTQWFKLGSYTDLVNGLINLTPVNGIPRWLRYNIIQMTGATTTVQGSVGVN